MCRLNNKMRGRKEKRDGGGFRGPLSLSGMQECFPFCCNVGAV